MVTPNQNPALQDKVRKLKELQGSRIGGSVSPLPVGGLMGGVATEGSPSLAQMELNKAKTSSMQRILSDPAVARSGNSQKLIADLQRIAAGDKPQETEGGISDAIRKGFGEFFSGVGYGLSRPVALVTSAAKELADIPTGGFSPKEFVSQALAKDTYPSKYIAKTGVDWIDSAIGLGVDIFADPMTYVTFGANQFAGRSGRILLASIAAQADVLAKAPSLAAKVANGSIAKLGEWALDAAERVAVGLPERPGLSYAFGKGSQIGSSSPTLAKLSQGAATAVGKPLAYSRGFLSDTGLFTGLQKITTPKKIKIAGLEMYGRAVDDPAVVDRVADLASYSAAVRANGAAAYVQKKFGAAGQALVKEISDYEASSGRRIFEVVEQIRPPIDDAEAALVDRMRSFLGEMRDYANTATNEFAGRRNVDAFNIAMRENYVPHTLTAEARKHVMGGGLAGTSSASAVKQMLGMNVTEFAKGPGVLRGRSLETGKKWLGVPLKSDVGDGAASIREINEISRSKLGFDWFEEDGAQYVSNYLDSIVNQTKRVAFVDRLFDYGGGVVNRLTTKMVPDTKAAAQIQKVIDGYDNLMAPILQELSAKSGGMGSILGPRLQLAKALVDLKPGEEVLSKKQMNQIAKVLDATFGQLSIAKKFIDNPNFSEVRYEYESVLRSVERNLREAQEALALNDQETLIGALGLRELYQRTFPDAEVPKDFRAMAEDILDAVDVYFSEPYYKSWDEMPSLVNTTNVARDSIEDILRNFSRDPLEIVTGEPDKVAANLKAFTTFIKDMEMSPRTQLFRGAKQHPIFDIFKDTEYPGKPISFSEDYNVADEDFVGSSTNKKIYSFEPGEVSGVKLDDFGQSILPNEQEWLITPKSIVGAVDEGMDPRIAERAKRQIDELEGKKAALAPETRSVQYIMQALNGKNVVNDNNARKKLIGDLADEIAELIELGVPEGGEKIQGLVKKIDEAVAKSPSTQHLLFSKNAWDNSVAYVYEKDINNLMKLAKKQPPPGAAGDVTAIWARKTANTLRALEGFGMVLSPEEATTMKTLVKQIKGFESNLAEVEAKKATSVEQYNKIFSEPTLKQISGKTIEGWQAIESLGIQMPPEVRDRMFTKVAELGTPEGAGQLRKMYDSYTRFFKITAMLSPGFVVRNSYTAAFNNFVAGVSVRETAEAMKFATNIWRFGVDKALGMVPESSRELYERALKVTYSTGAGQTYDDILAPVLAGKGAKWINSKPVKTWSNANETAEVAFRFALGMSSLKKGMDFDEATALVSRYHFDYTDLSSLDEVARRFIPFWIFASRNIPLQIINQIARPSVYRAYESVQRNYGLSEEEMQNYPEWLRNRGPLRLPGAGPNNVIIPDLPQLDMQEQIGMMSDPLRLLSQANPLVKLPIELAGGRQLWNDIPFSEKKTPVTGPLDYPAYAIDTLFGGAGKSNVTGERFTSSRAAYALPNLIPTLGQFQRLIPQLGGKDSYKSRQGSSAASYVGLPYRRVAPEEQFNELQRRQFAIRDYLSELTRRGAISPNER